MDFERFAQVCIAEQANAMKIFPYPCIASYSFLTTRICKNPFYLSLLQEIPMKRVLDIGCCVGSDVRRIITDGVSIENVVGVDLEEGILLVIILFVIMFI
jgi:2-polyprenyl-3-methyl-5-hydroxy-6-metoxy-1,4-benzoquinol methylase